MASGGTHKYDQRFRDQVGLLKEKQRAGERATIQLLDGMRNKHPSLTILILGPTKTIIIWVILSKEKHAETHMYLST